MKKDKNKKSKTYSQNEVKRYLGALSEVHNENLKAIKEGFQIVNTKLDSHTKVLDFHGKILASHSEMIGSLMENMEIVKEDISVIKGDLKQRVDYKEFSNLVKRVSRLESKI